MSSINDVARLAGVAKSTVSSVLTGNRYVSEETRRKVLRVCDELAYKPNFYASNIMNNNSNIIGLFLELNNEVFYEFYGQLIKAAILEANKYGYQILPYFAPDHDTIVENLKSGNAPLRGAIILSPQVFDERIECLKSNNIPFVVIGKPDVEIENLLSVDADNLEIVNMVLSYVHQMGHKRMLFLNSQPQLTVTVYRELASAEFIKANPDVQIHMDHVSLISGVSDILDRRMNEFEEITCIIAASDLIVFEIYDWCNKIGLKVGKDISVIALGGNTANIACYQVTRAYQDYNIFAAKCMEILHLKFTNKIQGSYFEKIDSLLIEGTSVADIRKE